MLSNQLAPVMLTIAGISFLAIGIHGMLTNKAENWYYFGNIQQIGVGLVLLILSLAIFSHL